MKKAASSKELGGLHDAIATVLAAQISETQKELDADGNTTDVEFHTATPALLTVAIKFLKDNDITCTVEDSKGLSEMQDELAKRRKRRDNIRELPHVDAEELYG